VCNPFHAPLIPYPPTKEEFFDPGLTGRVKITTFRRSLKKNEEIMEAYAVIETGGKQYRVQQGDLLDVEKLEGEVGTTIALTNVLALSNGTELTVGTPAIDGAEITAEIIDQYKGKKLVAFKKKRRKGYHRKIGHRQEITRLKVAGIKG
jgi:large subunit ribosomal protein L21